MKPFSDSGFLFGSCQLVHTLGYLKIGWQWSEQNDDDDDNGDGDDVGDDDKADDGELRRS